MTYRAHRIFVISLALATAGHFAAAQGAQTDTQTAQRNTANEGFARKTAGPGFAASDVWQLLFGSTWRDVWTTPISAPVLDLEHFAGGLKPEKSGGNQSKTLHFGGADGRKYVFRTSEKFIAEGFRADLDGTPVGYVLHDQISATHPAGAFIADALQTAAGVRHPRPSFVVMPDDPRLGKFRSDFGGQLGVLEEKPDNPPDSASPRDVKILGSDDLLSKLEGSMDYQVDARAWLTARLMDAIIGDFDRGADQWDWECRHEGSAHMCRPIARDRDWAFMHANGLLTRIARQVFPRLGSYDRTGDNIRSVAVMTHEFDRSHLISLDRTAWDSVAAALRAVLTDSVIDAALQLQPAAYQGLRATHLIALGLRARRDGLPELVRAYYDVVNQSAEVFAADDDDRVVVDRLGGGSVRVRMWRNDAPDTATAVFDRTFDRRETKEIRIYLGDGNDIAVVRGTVGESISVRITGGAGNDTLADSSNVSEPHTSTRFYDASGENHIVRGAGTHVDTRSYDIMQPGTVERPDSSKLTPRAVLEERRGRFDDQLADGPLQGGNTRPPRSWGATFSFRPEVDYAQGSGPILSAAATKTEYGFRHDPLHWRASARFMYAPLASGTQGVGAGLDGEWHPLNTQWALTVRARATGFESQRFFGYGNDTPQITDDAARIHRHEVQIRSAIRWNPAPQTRLSVGPVFRYVTPQFASGSPVADDSPERSAFAAIGAAAVFTHANVVDTGLTQRGYRVSTAVTSFAHAFDASGSFGRAEGSIAAYLPLVRPTLALRIGGARAWGAFPIHEAVMLGGRYTLRGFALERFAGNASAYGSAEIRLPLFRMTLLTRGRIGLIGLADAGRVWSDGASPGGWHRSAGGGISFSSLSRVVSATYARGEASRFYLAMGMPY